MKNVPDKVSRQGIIEERKISFSNDVKAIWSQSEEGSTVSVWISVRKKLRQFNLSESYSESHVLSESYCRGIATIEKGKLIPNPIAWMRLTSYNYIWELSRDQKKTSELDEERHASAFVTDNDDDADLRGQQLKIAKAALKRLKPSHQEIISLSILKGLSFRDIQLALQQKSGKAITEVALRKQKERAVKCLRDAYAELSGSECKNEHIP